MSFPTYSEYRLVQKFIQPKAISLMHIQKKEYAKAGFPINNYIKFKRGNKRYFLAQSNIFLHVMNDRLVEACQTFPDRFGKRNAELVLDAIYDLENAGLREDFGTLLSSEQFTWLVEMEEDDTINPKLLRVDLFRKILPEKDNVNNFEFIGGLFHSFKHFSYKGIPLSTHAQINDISHPTLIYSYLIEAFYLTTPTFISGKNYYSEIPFDDKYILRFDFYLEEGIDIYFIRSIRKESK